MVEVHRLRNLAGRTRLPTTEVTDGGTAGDARSNSLATKTRRQGDEENTGVQDTAVVTHGVLFAVCCSFAFVSQPGVLVTMFICVWYE